MATNKKIETSKIQKILKYIGVLMFLITSQESHECFSLLMIQRKKIWPLLFHQMLPNHSVHEYSQPFMALHI